MTLSFSTCLLTAHYSSVKGCLTFCPFIATVGLHESRPVSCSFIHSLFANIFSCLDKCSPFLSFRYLILKHLRYSWHKPGPMQNAARSYSYYGQFNWYQSLSCHWVLKMFSERRKEWKDVTKALAFFCQCCISGWGELDVATFSWSELSASEGCLSIGKPSFSFAACAVLSAWSMPECKGGSWRGSSDLYVNLSVSVLNLFLLETRVCLMPQILLLTSVAARSNSKM